MLLFLTPFLLGSVILYVLPALMTFVMAFVQYDGLTEPIPVGTLNFQEITSDPVFYQALHNSALFSAVSIPLRVAGALVLALLLHQRMRGVRTVRAAVFLPTVIPDTAFAVVALWIFNPLYGPLNMSLQKFGIMPPAWLADPNSAKWAFVIMSLFQIGEGFAILLAARGELPSELYETASTFGASRLSSFSHITLPLLTPWLLLMSVRDLMMSFQTTFTHAHIMTQGDPYYSTMFLPLLVYEEAFDRFRFGVGSAVMLMMFLASVALAFGLYKFLSGRRYGFEI